MKQTSEDSFWKEEVKKDLRFWQITWQWVPWGFFPWLLYIPTSCRRSSKWDSKKGAEPTPKTKQNTQDPKILLDTFSTQKYWWRAALMNRNFLITPELVPGKEKPFVKFLTSTFTEIQKNIASLILGKNEEGIIWIEEIM